MSESNAARAVDALAGKYMVFRLDAEQYAVEIRRVRELIGATEPIHLPGKPPHFRGVINLRGKVVPVVDLRLRFGLETLEVLAGAVFLVVDSVAGRDGLAGLLVDEVLDVLAIDGGDIEPPPSIGGTADSAYIVGVGKAEKRVVFLLDVDEVLGTAQR